MPDPSQPTTLPTPLDTGMFGIRNGTAAYLMLGERPALIDTGPASTIENVLAELDAAGIDDLGSIVLTHVHFDHAGGAGHLARRFPGATIYVHGRVAKHLEDPTILSKGVRSVWGPETDDLFGIPLPVAADRIRHLEGGDRIDLGDRSLRSIFTPGHTRAHLSFLDEDSGVVICGDALGIQVPEHAAIRPATPPVDFSTPDALNSIQRLKRLKAEAILMGHFGLAEPGPEEACEAAAEALHKWSEAYSRESRFSNDDAQLVRRIQACHLAALETAPPAVSRRLEAINPTWLNVAGLAAEGRRLSRTTSA